MNRSSPRIKICGITSPAAAQICAEAGADWIGLNFHSPSPRSIDPAVAQSITSTLPPLLKAVGLFVDRSPRDVADIATRAGVSVLQLHGDEPPEDLAALARWPIVRAFRLRDRASVDRMAVYLDRAERLGCPPFALLLDAHVAGLPGGTGHMIASDLLADLPDHPRIILAGGLNPSNVAERIRLARPWMVDVASGVESAPGRQDPDRVSAFVNAVRGES